MVASAPVRSPHRPPAIAPELLDAWIEVMATLGDVVRNERRAAEMATDELANLLGVDRSTVAGWETGHSVPRVGNLVMLWLVLPGMAHALDDHVTAARERHHAA